MKTYNEPLCTPFAYDKQYFYMEPKFIIEKLYFLGGLKQRFYSPYSWTNSLLAYTLLVEVH